MVKSESQTKRKRKQGLAGVFASANGRVLLKAFLVYLVSVELKEHQELARHQLSREYQV